MAGFKKGDPRINRNGRPRGSKNVNTQSLQQRISNFLDEHWYDFEKAILSLEAKDKALMMEKLLKYRIPAMKESDLRVNFSELSESEINTLIDKMLDGYGTK